MTNNDSVWIIGTGLIGMEYAKVLSALNIGFTAIGRGKENCEKFYNKTGLEAIEGGIENFLATNPKIPDAVIVAVGLAFLKDTTISLLNYGVKKILLEKPGVCYASEAIAISDLCKEKNATVVLAYNRRFYASVRKAKEIIAEDGGATSCQFDFTEWSHVFRNSSLRADEKANLFLGNSTHPIDTSFYLIGKPDKICCFYSGSIDWHPASSVFSGAGVSSNGTLFSYHANWEAPGRWSVEVMTKKHKLILRPMEKLQIQLIGSLEINYVEIDDQIDKDFKPGFYLQTKAFMESNFEQFCDIHEQARMMGIYTQMSGYTL